MRTFIIALAFLVIAGPAEAQFLRASGVTAAPRDAASMTFVTASTPLLRHLNADCDLDRIKGREAADYQHSGTGWMAGGFVSGILLGLIGTGITYAIANSSTIEVTRVPEGVESACYRDGYTSKAKGKNTSNALTGGLLGTALLVLLVVSATSSSGY